MKHAILSKINDLRNTRKNLIRSIELIETRLKMSSNQAQYRRCMRKMRLEIKKKKEKKWALYLRKINHYRLNQRWEVEPDEKMEGIFQMSHARRGKKEKEDDSTRERRIP